MGRALRTTAGAIALYAILTATTAQRNLAEQIQHSRHSFPSGVFAELSSAPAASQTQFSTLKHSTKGLNHAQQRLALGSSLWDHWPRERYGHSATIWRNKVYVFGGIGMDQEVNEWGYYVDGLADFWEYDIETELWTNIVIPSVEQDGVLISQSPPRRFYHQAFQMGHKLYIYGGTTVKTIGAAITNTTYLNDHWVYDPTAGIRGMWKELTKADADTTAGCRDYKVDNDMNAWHNADGPQYTCQWTVDNGKCLVQTAREYAYDDLTAQQACCACGGGFNYTGGEANVVPTPSGRHSASVSTFREKVYMFGGKNATGPLNELLVYSTELDTWQTVVLSTAAPPARYAHSAVFLSDEHMFIFGGQTSDSFDGILNDLWRFSPRTNAWMEITPMTFPSGLNAKTIWPPARTGHSAVGAIGGGTASWTGNRNKLGSMVIYAGWGGNDTYYGDVWTFHPGSKIWAQHECTASLNHQCNSGMVPTARWHAGVVAFHNLTGHSAHTGTSLFGFGGSRSQLGKESGYYDMFRYYV